MGSRRRTPYELSGILRTAAAPSLPDPAGGARGSPPAPAFIDLRDPRAFRRTHVTGSVSIPAGLLSNRLFLLPDRSHPLVLIAANGRIARAGAELLAGRGWAETGWLDGSPLDLPETARRSGGEPHRLWNPARILASRLDSLPVDGLCCDIACGSGREAAALAIGGRQVIGVDILPDALQRARLLARLARIPEPGRVRFRKADLRDPAHARGLLRKDRFRIVTCFRYLDRALLPLMQWAIAPGGYLIYETFLKQQAEAGRTPRRMSRLLDPGELRAAFSGLEVLEYREGADSSGDWLASLAARRPR